MITFKGGAGKVGVVEGWVDGNMVSIYSKWQLKEPQVVK